MHHFCEFRWPTSRRAAVLSLVCLLTLWLGRTSANESAPRTTLYDSDPQHLWNRLHEALFLRIGSDGREYGRDRLEPLLWPHSEHLLVGSSNARVSAVLEEFIKSNGEKLVEDPLRRAILQRDLWLVFNWLEKKRDDRELRRPLATIISRLALSKDQIRDLPDNYARAIASGEFAKAYSRDQPDQPYLPPDLVTADGPWVCLGRPDGPVALGHVREDLGNQFTNSAFLVFLRLPDGRAATLEFLERLRSLSRQVLAKEADAANLPKFPVGTELALVRRALLIDSSKSLVASPLTESVQLRVFRDGAQSFDEIRLSRLALFADRAGGLRAVGREERDFKTGFRAHAYDPFKSTRPGEPVPRLPQIPIRENCRACHSSPSSRSFISFFNFEGGNTDGSDTRHPVELSAVSPSDALVPGVKWKSSRPDWSALRDLLKDQ